jgi:hypothetical protein
MVLNKATERVASKSGITAIRSRPDALPRFSTATKTRASTPLELTTATASPLGGRQSKLHRSLTLLAEARGRR